MFKKSWHNWKLIGFSLFFFCLATQMVWLIAFFPGAMTNDSINIWQQSALGSGYINVQPFLYTYFLHFLRFIWNSPAIIAVLQVTFSSILVSYFSVFLLKKGANRWLVLATYLLFVFSFPVLNTNIIIHRDALNAQLLLVLSIIIVGLFFRDEREISNAKAIAIGAVVALFASMRYDAVIYIFFIPFLIYIFKLLSPKNIWTIFSAALILYLFVQIPLTMLLQVREGRFLQVEDMETRLVSGIYVEKPQLFTAEDLSLMTQLAKLKTWKMYEPTDDKSYWNDYQISKFWEKDFKSQWDRLFLQKIKQDPMIIVKDRLQMGFGLLRGEKMNSPRIVKNKLDLWQDEPLGKITGQFSKYFHMTAFSDEFLKFFLWSPFYLIVNLGFLAAAVIKKKKYLIAYSLTGLALFFAVLPGVTSGQFRYMFPIFYATFFIPALYNIKPRNEH